MNYMPKLNRRSFVVGTATAGLSLGFNVPFLTATSAQGAPEVNAWVSNNLPKRFPLSPFG